MVGCIAHPFSSPSSFFSFISLFRTLSPHLSWPLLFCNFSFSFLYFTFLSVPVLHHQIKFHSQESERISLIHHYNHAFNGFSAMLTESEASELSENEEVISVFKDPILKLHTTRSWDFLEAKSGMQISHQYSHLSSDVIIGMIDTGIWPESPSFDDKGIGEIPSRWKGICMEGHDFKKSNCNRKLIGARYYDTYQRTYKNNKTHVPKPSGSPRDYIGHGTHTTSIAGGSEVANVSYYGLAAGTARGGSPSTRLAIYKACSLDGCSGSIILKAMEDAIKDGVDIISISIGMSSIFQSDYLNDPIAIGAFHAQQMGVMVICSAGNDGPDPFTIVNSAPWIFTVAASNIDRDFQSTVLLGNGKTFQGSAINFSNLTRSRTYPLAFGEEAAAKFTPVSEASNCDPGSLDREKVAGKILVCTDSEFSVPRQIKKLVVEDAGAKGMLLIHEDEKGVPFDSGVFPFSELGSFAASQLLKYINSTKNPTATILPAVDVPRYKPAPVVAYFSSRGPGQLTENILKPDIMAPGVAILAAMIPKNESGSVPIGKKPSGYAIRSGTSMACPHVTGAAAFIKSVHRGWTPSMIKSALMTTATIYNNMGKPITNSSHSYSNPHEMGVGEINPLKALHPGLIFETTMEDYLQFLCYYGYSEKNIRLMANTKFNCPRISFDKLISNINYPSISISKLDRHQAAQITIKRSVINVGTPNATYIAKVEAPQGLLVKVLPKKLVFKEGLSRLSFKVSFDGQMASNGYNFGSVTWLDGRHSVRIVFTVNVE
ncbi:CO(2)-response secreted protease isoform X2 [Jatropha curcas]|uniref:CO(2)-response secreted protease isoform X2 n=1 Tax=Jatropha curcas TaxID=180498 RepID=UPI0009D65210|nr:CO(2)-response secreted protease isoform X2 [Jatropha curcas]